MRLTVFSLTVLALCNATPLHPRWDESRVKHSWLEPPRGWIYDSSPPPNHQIALRIGLKQSRIDELVGHLMQVSDPNHVRYGQHMSKEEAEELVSCHPDSIDAVKEWLMFHGIDASRVNHQKGGGDWLILQVSVAEAEKLLDTKYHVYQHEISGENVVRTLAYSLPPDLHSQVDIVTPTTYFGTLRAMRKTSFLQPEISPVDEVESALDLIGNPVVSASCARQITPACLRALYNTTSYIPKSTAHNRLGVVGYLNEFANNADLQTFLRKFRSDATGFKFPTVEVNGGGNNQSDPGVEANLDIQYTIGMSYPTPNFYYSTGGSPIFKPDTETPTNTNEPYLDWVTFILKQNDIPRVITTSYGDDEQTVPPEYATRVCHLFAQLGTLGTTLFFSSGDFGVGGGDCKNNDGTNGVFFQPAFPASCPYVTAVGATTNVNPEVAADFSGGGFSRLFAQPQYQAAAVSSYLRHIGTSNAGLYRRTGRAYPDLAAQGTGFQVVIGGSVVSVGGTSASSPTVAGIFALLNDYRLSKGRNSLGFINPLIYSLASSGFNDIVAGSNPGCGTAGFPATPGWDPVTGLGTPDFLKLRSSV